MDYLGIEQALRPIVEFSERDAEERAGRMPGVRRTAASRGGEANG